MFERSLKLSAKYAPLLVAVMAVTARAAEEAHGGHEAASPGLFTGDIGNIIWTLVTFIAVVVVLGKFAWRPILGGLKSREDFIRKSIDDAEAANKKAQSLLDEYKQKLDDARRQASEIVEEGRRDAEAVRKNIHDEARQEADAMLARAKREISNARDGAIRDLYAEAADLSVALAGKIIGKELSASDHQRLIDESIQALGKVDARKN